jgi:hypothetical protein
MKPQRSLDYEIGQLEGFITGVIFSLAAISIIYIIEKV